MNKIEKVENRPDYGQRVFRIFGINSNARRVYIHQTRYGKSKHFNYMTKPNGRIELFRGAAPEADTRFDVYELPFKTLIPQLAPPLRSVAVTDDYSIEVVKNRYIMIVEKLTNIAVGYIAEAVEMYHIITAEEFTDPYYISTLN